MKLTEQRKDEIKFEMQRICTKFDPPVDMTNIIIECIPIINSK